MTRTAARLAAIATRDATGGLGTSQATRGLDQQRRARDQWAVARSATGRPTCR